MQMDWDILMNIYLVTENFQNTRSTQGHSEDLEKLLEYCIRLAQDKKETTIF